MILELRPRIKKRMYIHHITKNFVQKIKKIRCAAWNGSAWTVDADFVPAVREIAKSIYGYDDTEEVEAVTLRITFMQDKEVYHDDIRLFGKTIASAYGRDSGAKLGKDAVLIKGNACSGGSVKNWRTIIVAESVILLNNVPRQMYEKKKGVYDPEEIKIEIVENDKIDINKLKEEKERLLKRIAEIDKVLTANAGEF